MERIHVDQGVIFPRFEEELRSKGCFIVVGNEEPNIMTIGWGTAGIMWGRPVVMIAVRLSRHSHEKLDGLKEFTVCIPKAGTMAKELVFAGTKSGRDFDKIKELSLETVPGEKVSVPVLSDCEYAYECKVVYETEMHEAHFDSELKDRHYRNGDWHTLYFGEIVSCYRMD